MTTYRDLTGHGVPTRTAAGLVGLPRATATRTPRTRAARQVVVPANRLDVLERARILTVVNSARFVEQPPAHRDRAQHPCRRPLRPRRRQGRRAGGDPRHRARPEPRALQHRLRPEDPRHPRRGLDQ